jgi:cytoskeletal protein RodZ
MTDLGARLKQARSDKGVSLNDIATDTKIAVPTLEALERNDFGKLPGGIFARAFVRAYAVAVGVEPEGAVTDFLTEYARWEKEREKTAKRPEISADDRDFVERQRRALRTVRSVLIIGAVALLGALMYLALVWWPHRK